MRRRTTIWGGYAAARDLALANCSAELFAELQNE
jgi:hypothetical protein